MWVTQLCSNLCNPMDCSLKGSSTHGILQQENEWVAIPFPRGSSRPRDWNQVSCIEGRLFTVWVTRNVCIALLQNNILSFNFLTFRIVCFLKILCVLRSRLFWFVYLLKQNLQCLIEDTWWRFLIWKVEKLMMCWEEWCLWIRLWYLRFLQDKLDFQPLSTIVVSSTLSTLRIFLVWAMT